MFRVRRMGCSCRHDGDFVLDSPKGFENYLCLFVKTHALFVINGVEHYTEPDTFIIYDKATPLYYKAVRDEYINDWIEFECSDNLEADTGLVFASPYPVGERVNVSQYFRLIADCYYKAQNHHAAGYLVKAMLSDVFSNVTGESASLPHYRELLDLRRRIYAEPNEDWTVGLMSSMINVSEPYLPLIYKKAFGITCNADVINSRIEAARHYLECSQMTIEEIAFECGYKNPVHFSRQFKQVCDLSPLAYRKQNTAV